MAILSPKKIYVVCGNHSEFYSLLRKKESEYYNSPQTEAFPKYTYVSNINHLRGLDKIEGFYYGTYEQRNDINELRQIIETIKTRMK